MSTADVARVRDTWALIEPLRDAVAQQFYERLFVIAPALRSMFPDDMHAQGAKLVATLNVAVVHLDGMDAIDDTLRQLGLRHLQWRVRQEHYAQIGDALQWTLSQGLGDRFTPEVAAAWRAAYDAVAGPMIEAAYGPGAPDTADADAPRSPGP